AHTKKARLTHKRAQEGDNHIKIKLFTLQERNKMAYTLHTLGICICLNKTHVICYTRRGTNKTSLTIEDQVCGHVRYKTIYIVQPSRFNPCCCGERGWHQSYFIKASHFLHWTYQTASLESA